MARPTTAELVQLLIAPTESVTIEHKNWLNLALNPHKAILAKAAIALANEGGGIIVLGTREDITLGGALGSCVRPDSIARYSLDDINNVIGRFADPAFHCELVFATHPETQVEHAFVLVPGGMTVPVMACRGSDGEIQAQRCYVRKPGPKSEEPYTAEEWRGVMERCLQARRESMLDAIRVIVQGHTDTPIVPSTAKSTLVDFIAEAQGRWQALIASLPNDDAAGMPHGYYTIGFALVDIDPFPTLAALRRYMENASRTKLTGWTPFVYAHEARPVDGMVERWVGEPDHRHVRNDPAHCDFWRAHPAGQFFLLRGYDEDGLDNVEAGVAFDITLPIWRVGEALLYTARVARAYAADPEILIIGHYHGLRGRKLVNLSHFSTILAQQASVDDDVIIEGQARARQIEDTLVEVLYPLLRPLYERFGFFELSSTMVTEQVAALKKGRF